MLWVITDAAQITMQLCFNRRMDKMLPVLGAEHEVDVVFYE